MNLGSMLFGRSEPKTEKSPVKVFSKEDIDLFNLFKSHTWLMRNLQTVENEKGRNKIIEEMKLRGLSEEDYKNWLDNSAKEILH